MRFIITVTPQRPAQPAEAEAPFNEALFIKHMEYNEAMHKAGVLVAGEGLNPAGRAAHVGVSGDQRTVIDGPFAETKELVGGFYLLEVSSLEEATTWAKRYPGAFSGDELLEIRPLTGAGDLPAHLVELIRTAAPTWSRTFDKAR